MEPQPGQIRGELSPSAMQEHYLASGYSFHHAGECISGYFSSVQIYAINGLVPLRPMVISEPRSAGDLHVHFGIGKCIGELSRVIVGEDLPESDLSLDGEQHDFTSILLILTSKHTSYSSEPGYYQDTENFIYFERKMFATALRAIEDATLQVTSTILPSISFGITPSDQLFFKKLKTIYFGRTHEGKLLLLPPTLYLTMTPGLGVSQDNLKAALDLFPLGGDKNTSTSDYLFSLGLTEEDAVKRFLFFYLAIARKIEDSFEELRREKR